MRQYVVRVEECMLRPSSKESIKKEQDTWEKLVKDLDIEQLHCSMSLDILWYLEK
jgi:hypothetical protein